MNLLGADRVVSVAPTWMDNPTNQIGLLLYRWFGCDFMHVQPRNDCVLRCQPVEVSRHILGSLLKRRQCLITLPI